MSNVLREAFALLLVGNQRRNDTLSADALRSIRRRVAARWAGGLGALAIMGTLGVVLTVGDGDGPGPDGAGRDGTTNGPLPTPRIGFAAADFPLTGGPEFVQASAGLMCGDPAPSPNSVEHGLRLEVTPGSSEPMSHGSAGSSHVASARAVLSSVTNEVRGTVSTSGIDILVVQQGVIKGVFDGGRTELDVGLSLATPADWPRLLVTERTHCPSDLGPGPSEVTDGTYQLIAVGRVFSTPESVALSQAVAGSPVQFLETDPHADRHAVYLPGSYDCQQLVASGSVARPCLPDVTDTAVVDAKAGTVSVLYKKRDLVDEFVAVLVSEPLTATIVSSAVLGPADWEPWDGVSPFTSLDSFTCGASGLGRTVGTDATFRIEATYDPSPVAVKQKGGMFAGAVFVPDAPDDSTVDLLPGARLIFLKDYTLVSPVGMATTNVSTVVASAPLTAEGPMTTDRFAGPQTTRFSSDAATVCPGADPDLSLGKVHAALVGQWRVTEPDGTVTIVDSANDPAVTYGYAR